jgi:protein SCO1/2
MSRTSADRAAGGRGFPTKRKHATYYCARDVSLARLRLITFVGAAAVLALIVVLSLLARLDLKKPPAAAAEVPAPLAIGTELQRPRQVPSLQLIDERGKPFSLSAWRGKWVILAPSMTLCHEVCPLTTGALTELVNDVRLAGLSHQVVIAEATVDPWRDSPFRLREYKRLTGANFEMFTGTQSEIKRLWRFFGVYYARAPQGKPPDVDWLTHKPETFDVQHTDAIFFMDPAGQERIVDEGMADLNGQLSPVLKSLLTAQGTQNLVHPQLPWTAAEALDDLYFLMNRNVPAGAVPKVSAPSAADAARALAGSPGSLASLHAQAGQLIASGGTLSDRLRSLRGYPVVLNAWASWCGPCRTEFPLMAAASTEFGRKVAFLGADTDDSSSDARTFLSRHPVSYPSYRVASNDLSSLAVLEGLPTTIFLSPAGKVVFVHTGQYDTQAALDNDIQQYALGN